MAIALTRSPVQRKDTSRCPLATRQRRVAACLMTTGETDSNE
jgi:hypothetical protein